MASLEKQETKKLLPSTEEPSKPKPLSSLKTTKVEKGSSKKEVTIKKPEAKEFSPKIKQIIKRLRFRLKLYIGVMKAKEINKDDNEPTNPEYKILVKILKNPYRSNESAQRVLDFIRHLPFFNEFISSLGEVEDRALHELCKRLKYEYAPAGTYVFREGDNSDHKYYIVLRGQVSVVKKRDTNVFYQMRLARLKAIDEEKTPEEIKMENLIGEMGTKVKDINEGEGFEEKALIEQNSKRGYSILTNTTCEFIVVLKEDYNQIMSRFDQKRNMKKEFMMKSIPFLDSINSMAIIEDLFYLLKDEDLPRDATIVTEGHVGNYVYFIASGECTVEKTFAVRNIKRGADYGSFEVKKVIATIDAGSCFGEELLLEDNESYKYTIKVKSSSASFHYVDKSVFLMKFPPECIRMVMESFRLKNSVHQGRIHELSKDVMETANEKHEAPPRLKGAEIFRLLRPQYRMKMAQHLYKTLKRNVNSISNPQGVLDGTPENKIRIPLEDIVDDNGTASREPQSALTTPMRTKTPGSRAYPTNFPDVHTLQIGNKSVSSRHNRTLTRRLNDPNRLENSDVDSFNKTVREKPSFGELAASSNRKDTSARKTMVKFPHSPSKRDEIELEKRPNNDYFSNTNSNSLPKMEKFDFGPSPYLTDKYQKLPRVATNSQISFHSSKLEPSSATLKLGQLDFDEARQARHEFTNLIERVRGDRTSPAVFAKLTGFISKKRNMSNKKKLRRNEDGNLIMIRSIAATSTSLAKGSFDFSEYSPSNRPGIARNGLGSLEEIGTDRVREDDMQSSFKRMGSREREGWEYLTPETPKLMTKTRVKISRENTKSLIDSNLFSMVKGRYQDKLQEKSMTRSKIWPVK